MFGFCFVGVGGGWGLSAGLGLVGCWACMAALIDEFKFGVLRGPEAQKKKEERQDVWIEKLIRGLTVVARDVPQARGALYQLLAGLCIEARR